MRHFLKLLSLAPLWAGTPSAQGQPVVMLFAGDLVLSDHVERAVGEDVRYVFARWEEVGQYDVFMVNLEHPVTTHTVKVEKEFNFKMHPKYLQTLLHGRISVVNAANNHVADYGLRGIEDTMRSLDSVGIRYVGIGRTLSEARKPVILEIRGRRIGFLGYHGGGRFAATATQAGLAPRIEQIILEDVKSLRDSVDYLVVNFHWGVELAEQPDPEQVRLAHKVVEAGANLIVGHHPHILQGIERFRGGTIAYSLGNFIFGGNSRRTYHTALLRVELRQEQADIRLIPVTVENWQPRIADPEEAMRVVALVRKRSEPFRKSIFLTGGSSQ